MTHARIINPDTREPAETGLVAEVIEWEPEGRYPPEWVWVECPSDTRQFAVFDGETFVNPPEPEPPVYVPPPPVFPKLTRRQLRLGLLNIGITADIVEAQLNAIADPMDRAAAMIEWQDASSYERDHPVLVQVAAALNLPTEQVDALWMWAAGL